MKEGAGRMGCGRNNRWTVGKGRYLKDTLCYGIMHKVDQHYDNCVDFGYPGGPSGISDLKPKYLTVLEEEDSPRIRPIRKLDCGIKPSRIRPRAIKIRNIQKTRTRRGLESISTLTQHEVILPLFILHNNSSATYVLNNPSGEFA